MKRRDPRPERIEKLRWIATLAREKDGVGCRIWPWSKSHYARIGKDSHPVYVGHVILMRTGRPKPFPKAHMLHSCDVKSCVAPWHLRWGTNAENIREALDRGLQRRGHQKHNTHLLEGDVLAIRAASDRTPLSLAQEYGVHVVTIHKMLRGETWKHILPTGAPRPASVSNGRRDG